LRANFEIVIAISLHRQSYQRYFKLILGKKYENKTEKKFLSPKTFVHPIFIPLENPVSQSPKNTTNQDEFQGNFDDTFDGEFDHLLN